MKGGKRVLVVDDDPMVSGMVCRLLDFYANITECTEAHSGQVAIELVERGCPYDLIVSDIRMPGVTGIDLHRRVKGKLGMTKFVFMSGGLQSEDLAYVVRENVRLLYKPFTASELVSVL